MFEHFPIKKIEKNIIPLKLLQIPKPPKSIYIRGKMPESNMKVLCVVGTRKYTNYGKEVCKKLIEGLKGYPIVIVSGLALGIDTIAHESAINAGLITIGVPGSGLDENVIYPRTNTGLAKRILESGGCLLSEFDPNFKATLYSFPQRNRIMAGLSDAVLVIEAERISGTLITARLATEYNRDVFTVPGSIFSSTSEGPMLLMKLGATPIATSNDVVESLGLNLNIDHYNKTDFNELNPDESVLVNLLKSPLSRDELVLKTKWTPQKLSQILTLLEIKGIIHESLGKIYRS